MLQDDLIISEERLAAMQERVRHHLESVATTITTSNDRIAASTLLIRRVLEFVELTQAQIERSRRLLADAKSDEREK